MNTPNRMTKRVSAGQIVLVGASVRSAAESAARGKLDVIGVDCFGDVDTRRACQRFISATNPSLPDQQFIEDLIAGKDEIPVLQVGGLVAPHPLISRLLNSPRRIGAADQSLDDPKFLQRLADAAAVQFPEIRSATTATLAGRWLYKQRASSGGLGVRDRTRGERSMAVQHKVETYCQRWIEGRSYGATVLSNEHNTTVLAVCRGLHTRSGRRPFVYAGSYGPVAVPEPSAESLDRFARILVKQTGLRGLFNIDFLLDPQHRVHLLEVNPRWSASMEIVERSLGDPLLPLGVKAICGESFVEVFGRQAAFEHPRKLSARWLKRVVYARQTVTFHLPPIQAQLREQEYVTDIPSEGARIRKGQPVCSLIMRLDAKSTNWTVRYRALLRNVHREIERKTTEQPAF